LQPIVLIKYEFWKSEKFKGLEVLTLKIKFVVAFLGFLPCNPNKTDLPCKSWF
jgi:hypothetical protein